MLNHPQKSMAILQKAHCQPIKHTFVAYYIDSGASAEQKEALRKLFAGPSFAAQGQAAEVKEVPINFENLDAFAQVGKKVSATVGELGKVEVTPIPGAAWSAIFASLVQPFFTYAQRWS
jgi:hypothetical protein